MMSIEFASPVVAPSPSLGEQCGRVFALLYPTATEQERRQAAQADAERLVAVESDRPAFVAAWEQGVRAATASTLAQVNAEPCPCCGACGAFSRSTLITWQEDEAGAFSFVPRPVCPTCAALDSRRQYQTYLERRQPLEAPGAAVLLVLLIRGNVPAHLIAEQIAAACPRQIHLRASGAHIALLVESLESDAIRCIASLICQKSVDPVCIATVPLPRQPGVVERCPCGHLLRSRVEQRRRRCLECQLAMYLRNTEGERSLQREGALL